jgi:asparagine synthase (glutamine-hydrolysing)
MQVQKPDAGAVTSAPPARWHAGWVATFGPRGDTGTGAQAWRGADRSLVLEDAAGSDVQVDASHDLVVIFAGVLTNAAELSPRAELDDAARIVAARFRAKGEAAFDDLRGPFAVLAWERGSDRLVVARDHVGIEPIFYAQRGETWHFSPSPDRLVAKPDISRDIDAVAFAEWLCGWFPAVEDTGYRDVKRVPPATLLTVEGAHARGRRYWDLWPDGSHEVDWLEESDLDQFGPLLRRAVDRTLRPGPSTVFLSGGLDSIAVAATATSLARESRRPPPLALSLVFPGTASEEPVQVGAARTLGLEHVRLGFEEAAGREGLLAGALEVSADWPQPMWNIWSPAYRRLAERGDVSRCRVLLTGRGGDEWLTISPYLLADQVRHGDLLGAWRLIEMRRRSNGLSGAGNIARLLWLTAGRSLASAALDTVAPRAWHARRRRRLLAERPRWVAPDPAIRRAMADRVERWMEPARPRHGFYAREGRTALRHPAVTHDMEETQEFGRRLGLRVLHPFWDIDLVSMLHRVPPRLLMQDGRSKSLLRRRLSQEFPGLGLETRGKGTAAHVFRTVMEEQAPPIMRTSGGPTTLARLGVVEVGSVDYANSTIGAWGGPGRLWAMLNLETWARQRSQPTRSTGRSTR